MRFAVEIKFGPDQIPNFLSCVMLFILQSTLQLLTFVGTWPQVNIQDLKPFDL